MLRGTSGWPPPGKEESTDPEVTNDIEFLEIPKKRYPKRSKASECREILGELRWKLKAEAPKEDGIIIEDFKQKQQNSTTTYKQQLPLPKNRK